jgi:hypothetical protein
MAEANNMKTIGDILSRDLNRKIVEVIQVDADKDEDLYSEITEYIATDRSSIGKQLREKGLVK